ncbi:hypothetical protein [Lysobacter hankyongensis]|uniref:DUF4231 domain-containing protein n=1 Tax=Lysobacter hankyongensis TaxID=1176535 RepID=A0ABP9C379_9GAMM
MISEDQLPRIRELLSAHEARYRLSAQAWKITYRVLLVASILFSTFAALIGKLYSDGEIGNNIASILAFLAAASTALVAALDFELNARINRRSRHEVGLLLLESEKSTANPDTLLCALQEVVKRRSEELSKPD